MWSDVGYAHQVFHHLVCGCWCRTLLSSFTWVQLLEQVWSQSLDTVVVPVILSFQQCPALVRITFFKRVHCSVSTDTLSLWSRHFTRLCSSTHPWQRVSEIQFIKEVLYRSSIHWWVFSMLLVYTQQYSGWPYTTSDVWKLHNTHNASTTTGLSSAVCNLCSRFDDAFEAVWNWKCATTMLCPCWHHHE